MNDWPQAATNTADGNHPAVGIFASDTIALSRN